MTKFEEEFKALTSWDWVNVDLIQQILTRFGNWHSDEEYQNKEREIKRLRKINHLYKKAKGNAERLAVDRGERLNQAQDEIESLESQLQQQALPVVPEDVDEFITKVQKVGNSLTFAFNSKFNECPAEYWNEAIVWRLNNPDEFARAWLDGYTVEKPQLFRVCLLNGRHTLTRRDPRKTLPFNYTFLWSYSSELKEMREINKEVDLFTEEEIKSIDERYWQFAVPAEDGE